jgi:ribonuclease HI
VKLTVNVDGGARGNPGPAAIGVVVRDSDGGILATVSETIGEATNNVAEYRALIAGIQQAKLLGADRLELFGDSELVVKQVRGEYKVKNPGIRPLHAEVVEALRGFDDWSIDHVRREQNADADALVNDALDGRESSL